MTRLLTSGVWTVRAGSEDEFVAAWRDFATWASTQPGAGPLTLARDRDQPNKFVSFGFWDSADSAHAWKSRPEFGPRIGAVRELCDAFEPGELDVATIVQRGETIS
jgi:heme-degrading monooxygenase HmoA